MYRFYGAEAARQITALPTPSNRQLYPAVTDPCRLYDILLAHGWSAATCAPRLRGGWSHANPTMGQCSITAFLAQDIFGGAVYGVRLEDGAYHCYNIVDGILFDLASEQFGDIVLDYSGGVPQSRAQHFADAEKEARYRMLCAAVSAHSAQ